MQLKYMIYSLILIKLFICIDIYVAAVSQKDKLIIIEKFINIITEINLIYKSSKLKKEKNNRIRNI